MKMFRLAFFLPASPCFVADAGEVSVGAESFKSSGGWEVVSSPAARSASGLATLNGAGGAKDGVATTTVSIKDAGHYRIWVRYKSHPKWRGPFQGHGAVGCARVGRWVV